MSLHVTKDELVALRVWADGAGVSCAMLVTLILRTWIRNKWTLELFPGNPPQSVAPSEKVEESP